MLHRILLHLKGELSLRGFLAIAACVLAIGIPAVAESKEASGKVVVYTAWNETDMNKLTAAFNKVYPKIEVESVRSEGKRGGLLERLLTEIGAGKYFGDVYCTGTIDMAVMAKRGLLAAYKSPGENNIDSRFRSGDGITYPNCLLVYMGVYNKNLLKKNELPTTWDDLLNPKWKGKIGLDQEANEFAAGIVMKMGEEKGWAYLKKLSSNTITRKGKTLILELLAAGEYPLALEVYAHRVAGFEKQGAPVGALALPHYVATPNLQAIIKNAPHLENAKTWIDWSISPNGQQAMAVLLNRGLIGKTEGAKDPQGHLLEGRELVVLNLKTMPSDWDALNKKNRDIFLMGQ